MATSSFLGNLASDTYTGIAGFGKVMTIGIATLATLAGAVVIYTASQMIIKKQPTVDQNGKPIDPVKTGWFAMMMVFIILSILWFFVWLTQRYKIFAAAVGVNDVIGFL